MKIKQTTFYAFRMIYRIHREGDGLITSKEIAEKEEISHGVALRILGELSRAGLLLVYRGRGQISGGFSLAKSIDEITMSKVVKILEGIDISASMDNGSREKEKCLVQICSQMNQHLEEVFSMYTIRRLFENDALEMNLKKII